MIDFVKPRIELRPLLGLPGRSRHSDAAMGAGGWARGTYTIAPPAPALLWGKKNVNYYRRYPGDYVRDTSQLSLMQHGAYCLLLDYCYGSDHVEIHSRDVLDPFENPSRAALLYRICGASTRHERAAVRYVVEHFFPGGRNPRVARQLPEELERKSVAKANGALGGRPKEKPSGLFIGNPTETQRFRKKNLPMIHIHLHTHHHHHHQPGKLRFPLGIEDFDRKSGRSGVGILFRRLSCSLWCRAGAQWQNERLHEDPRLPASSR